jgi:DNA-binding protein HU-beta
VTKAELVDQVAVRAELPKQDAARAVDAVLATIEDALRRGSEVAISGFGKFHVGERGAREGVNPRTGERIQIGAARVPRFTAGSGLKTAVKRS